MALDILMNVLTSVGYEPMYPFSPRNVLNATFSSNSTATAYQVTIDNIITPLTNSYGNKMGLIVFIPTVAAGAGCTLSINGDTAYPIVFSNGTQITAGTVRANTVVVLKYYDSNFYLIMDKYQIGLGNVDNTSDVNKPVSTAVRNLISGKMNTPTAIPSGANLNNYYNAGFYYCTNGSTATNISNRPITDSYGFSLLIEGGGGGSVVKQIYTNIFDTRTTSTGIRTWVRTYMATSGWSNWYQQAYILSGTGNPSNTVGADGNIYIKYES